MDFLDLDFLVHFLEDELLYELFLVVFFFVFGFDGLPLVLQGFDSFDIALVEQVDAAQLFVSQGFVLEH